MTTRSVTPVESCPRLGAIESNSSRAAARRRPPPPEPADPLGLPDAPPSRSGALYRDGSNPRRLALVVRPDHHRLAAPRRSVELGAPVRARRGAPRRRRGRGRVARRGGREALDVVAPPTAAALASSFAACPPAPSRSTPRRHPARARAAQRRRSIRSANSLSVVGVARGSASARTLDRHPRGRDRHGRPRRRGDTHRSHRPRGRRVRRALDERGLAARDPSAFRAAAEATPPSSSDAGARARPRARRRRRARVARRPARVRSRRMDPSPPGRADGVEERDSVAVRRGGQQRDPAAPARVDATSALTSRRSRRARAMAPVVRPAQRPAAAAAAARDGVRRRAPRRIGGGRASGLRAESVDFAERRRPRVVRLREPRHRPARDADDRRGALDVRRSAAQHPSTPLPQLGRVDGRRAGRVEAAIDLARRQSALVAERTARDADPTGVDRAARPEAWRPR